MMKFKKAFLSPYMILFCTGVLIAISAYQLFQIDGNTTQTEPDKVYDTQPMHTPNKKKVNRQLPAELPIQDSPNTEPFQNNETQSSVPIPKPPPETANNNAHHLDANLDDLSKVLEKELFKDVPPELLADIEIIVSDEDTKSLLEKLQSDPNLNKEKQVYIDIIKQSIEDKNYIETKQ